MTNREKVARLQRYRLMGREIMRLREELAQWRSWAEGGAVRYQGEAAGGAAVDRVQSGAERIDRLERQLEEKLCRLLAQREQLEGAIDRVSEDRLRLLLRYRYLNGWTWERIAVELNYDIEGRNVHKLHGKALDYIKLDTELHTESVI